MASPAELYERIDAAGRGRIGPATSPAKVGGYLIVGDDPATLANSAGVDLQVYSLARMIASEDGSAPAPRLLALAETTRNEAARGRVSIFALLTRSSVSAAKGKYSEQAAGKWASTRVDPLARHLEAARIAIEDGSDVFGGATDFFDPRAQDKGKQGEHTLKKTSEDYITDKLSDGMAWIGQVDGIDPYRLMLFSHQKDPDLTENFDASLEVVFQGRGWEQTKTVAVVSLAGVALLGALLLTVWSAE